MGARGERSGPYVRVRDDVVVRDASPERGSSPRAQHAFPAVIWETEYPIAAGLPRAWMHAVEELYDRLRGPAEELTVLATAWSDPTTGARVSTSLCA